MKGLSEKIRLLLLLLCGLEVIWYTMNSFNLILHQRYEESEKTVYYDDTLPPQVVSVPLHPINTSLSPLYGSACCGIGHRLVMLVPTIICK